MVDIFTVVIWLRSSSNYEYCTVFEYNLPLNTTITSLEKAATSNGDTHHSYTLKLRVPCFCFSHQNPSGDPRPQRRRRYRERRRECGNIYSKLSFVKYNSVGRYHSPAIVIVKNRTLAPNVGVARLG
jgi:hypothetical protein